MDCGVTVSAHLGTCSSVNDISGVCVISGVLVLRARGSPSSPIDLSRLFIRHRTVCCCVLTRNLRECPSSPIDFPGLFRSSLSEETGCIAISRCPRLAMGNSRAVITQESSLPERSIDASTFLCDALPADIKTVNNGRQLWSAHRYSLEHL